MPPSTLEVERAKAIEKIDSENVDLEDLRDEAIRAILMGKEYGAHLLAAIHLKDLEAAVRELIASLKK